MILLRITWEGQGLMLGKDNFCKPLPLIPLDPVRLSPGHYIPRDLRDAGKEV